MSYLWIFIGVFTLIFFIFFVFSDADSILETMIASFIGAPLLGCFIGFIVFLFGSVIFTQDFPKEEVIISQFELEALNQDKQIEGDLNMFFFVGSGYIGETEYYVYYKKYKNGDIKFEKVRAEAVFLNQSDSKPRIVKYGERFKQDVESGWLMESEKSDVRHTRTVLYIPKGTIKRNFKIN